MKFKDWIHLFLESQILFFSKQAGTTEIEIINEELQQSISDRMEIQKPASSDGNSKKATITKQNSEECRVSDLMEILDNDLFNPQYVGFLF